ncbi:hypothetical protein E2C01_026913 [Portunus trituberculatus]|uniref:Uncharacterized protein n=1 Tax=Portunus trituberculatus TaxID=210409 RepID=A0A5B7EJQ1_PORTR|nr:hypothetical protein [Portunus trituberculatus]
MAIERDNSVLNPFSTMACFHIHSAYYMTILYSFRNLREGSK